MRGRQPVCESPRQHLHAAFNRVLSAVAGHGLQEVPQPDEPVGKVRLRRHVAVRADLEVLPRDRIGDLVQNLLGCAVRPRMPVVVLGEAPMPAREWEHRRGLAAEFLDRPQGRAPEVFPDVAVVAQDRAVQDDRGAMGRERPQAQFSYQLAQGIGTDRLVVVALGDAGLVRHRRGIESPSLHFATETAARFEQRDLHRRLARPFEQVRRHQAGRSAANDRHAGHISVLPGNRIGGPGAPAGMPWSFPLPVNEKHLRTASSSPATR